MGATCHVLGARQRVKRSTTHQAPGTKHQAPCTWHPAPSTRHRSRGSWLVVITPTHYMLLSAALFMIGVVGVLVRRNIIIIFMSIELILNAVNINLVAFSKDLQHVVG